MRLRIPVIAAIGAAGFVAIGGGTAHAAGTPLPAHVFAPYFEAYNGDSPVTLSQESGAKYLTFAFIQTASSGSCTAYWNGDTSMPISAGNFRQRHRDATGGRGKRDPVVRRIHGGHHRYRHRR